LNHLVMNGPVPPCAVLQPAQQSCTCIRTTHLWRSTLRTRPSAWVAHEYRYGGCEGGLRHCLLSLLTCVFGDGESPLCPFLPACPWLLSLRKVVLEVKSEPELRGLSHKLTEASIPHKLWVRVATCTTVNISAPDYRPPPPSQSHTGSRPRHTHALTLALPPPPPTPNPSCRLSSRKTSRHVWPRCPFVKVLLLGSSRHCG
jgi:hypothetical protein